MKKLIFPAFILSATILASFALFQRTSWNNRASEPDSPTTTQYVKAIEIRYFPNQNDIPHHPDQLSPSLREIIRKGSAFHSYKNPNSISSVNVDIVKTINYNNNTPTGTSWREIWDKIFETNNLCSLIKNENIDYIWVWSNSEPQYSTGPGIEYAISSKYFQNNLRSVTVANPPFCNGDRGIVVFNFAYNREVGEAAESFNHYMEGLITNLQGHDFFWLRYAGAGQGEFLRSERCGAVHFPPNVSDSEGYIYYSQRSVNNFCENWQPEGKGQMKTINCSEWNCNKSDFFIWWMANMPNQNTNLTFEGKTLPNWWGSAKDLDASLINLWSAKTYYLNDQFFVANSVPTLVPIPQPLVKNNSFEKDSNSNNLPDDWLPKNLGTGDQLTSGKSFEGNRSFKFTSSPTKVKKLIKQVIPYNGKENQAVTFTFQSKTNKLMKGMSGGILRLNFTNGTGSQVAFKIPSQIHNWAQDEITMISPKPYSSVTATLYNSNTQTSVWFDDVTVKVVQPYNGQEQTKSNLTLSEQDELANEL